MDATQSPGWGRPAGHLARGAIIGLFGLAVLVRIAAVLAPLERPTWHEADVAAIARDFAREGIDPLHPRVDWRGDGPGIVEGEFPALAILTALLPGAERDPLGVGRWVGLPFGVLAIWLAARLGRRLGGVRVELGVLAFLALHPLHVRLSASLLPENPMLAASIAAVLAFDRWLDGRRTPDAVAAGGALALALLFKPTAIAVGPLFAAMVLGRLGRKAIRTPAVWGIAAGALIPAAAWTLHARSLWRRYGLSMGVSDEAHFLDLALLRDDPLQIAGIGRLEAAHVWTRGWLLAVLASLVWFGLRRLARGPAGARLGRAFHLGLVWYGGVFAFFLALARTAGDAWAFYYHALALPPAALIAGAVLGGVVAQLPAATRRPARAVAAIVLLCAVYGAFDMAARVRHQLRDQAPNPVRLFCQSLQPILPPDALIAATGGPCTDSTGAPVAWHDPFPFLWTDRKGFSICAEEQSLEAVEAVRARGAQFYLAEPGTFRGRQGELTAIEKRYRAIARCPEMVVYDLRRPAVASER